MSCALEHLQTRVEGQVDLNEWNASHWLYRKPKWAGLVGQQEARHNADATNHESQDQVEGLVVAIRQRTLGLQSLPSRHVPWLRCTR